MAVKAFRLDLTPEQARALAAELQDVADAALDHPSIVRPIAAGVEGTLAYAATEYVAAESLDIALRHYAPASLEVALPFITQLAGAIDFARTAGVGHGALHPRDVFVTPDEARATGFGIVQALDRLGVRAPVRRPYTAPERVAQGAWDVRADVYSLAAIAYELLTGRRPVGAAIDELGETAGPHAAAIATVLSRALAEDPRIRFPGALAFAAALEAASRGERAPAAVEAVHEAAEAPAGRSLQYDLDEPGQAPAPDEEAELDADLAEIQLREEEAARETAAREDGAPSLFDAELVRDTDRDADRAASGSLAAATAGALHEPEPFELPSRAADDTDRAPSEPFDYTGTDPERAEAVDRRPLEPVEPLEPNEPAEPLERVEPVEPYEPVEPRGRPRPVLLPVAVTLLLGLFVGFLAGYLVGARDRGGTAGDATLAETPAPAQTGAPSPGTGSPRPVAPHAAPAGTQRPATEASRTAPARPAPSPATTGRLVVRSTPAGAQVFVNGRRRGTTPLSVRDLAAGTYTVRVARSGYQEATQRVSVGASGVREVTIRLTRPAPAPAPAPASFVGALYVDSRPRGARVLIDGKEVGTTPLQIGDLRAGTHVVRMELPNHRPWSSSARVVAGQTVRVTGSLEPR